MIVTAVGSLPGTDVGAATRLVLTELPQLPPFPELPARGVGADLVGRALTLVQGLAFDLQPAGWRLTDHPGADLQRARAMLRRDLDDWEEAVQGWEGTMKLAVAGPWTLAALVERPRGDRILADHGARRDLAEALAEGVGDLLRELCRRVPGITWMLQVDEPLLPAVQEGRVPTASGFSRHRGVDQPELADLLGRVLAGSADSLQGSVLHCCASGLDLAVPGRAGFATVSLDTGQLGAADLDELARWVDRGGKVWWGVLSAQQLDQVPRPDALARTWRSWVARLGLDEHTVAAQSALTPSCGLAGWSLPAVPRALRALRAAADLLEEELA